MFTRQPLRRQVVLAACVVLLPLIGAISWAATQTRDEWTEETRRSAASLATAAASSVDEYLSAVSLVATTLALHPSIRSAAAQDASALLRASLDEQSIVLDAVLVDADHRIVAAAATASVNRQGVPSALARNVAEVLRSGSVRVTNLVESPAGASTAVVVAPVRDQSGATTGALLLWPNIKRLQDTFSGMPVSAGTVVTVLDGDERIVLRSRDGARFVGETMPWTGGQPDAAQPDVDGVERLSTTARLGAAPWRVVVGIARGQVFERVLAIWRRNLLLAMLALGASFGIALIVSIRLSAHIERLRTAAARIAAGDLTPLEPDVMPSRELEELQQAFVTMAARLREARDAHARQVDQERAMNEHLQSLQRHLVRQERVAAVGQLAAGVAHELNNPLQAILGAAEMLERNRGMNADALEDVAFVKGQALRARNTIRSLSRFSTAPPTTLQPVDLRDVIAEVLQLRAPQLAALRVKVTVHPGSMRPVAGSFTELAQVVLHLLAGGTEAPRIDVRLFDAGPRVRLEVHDNGPGVPAEHESRLFQPFFTTRLVGEGAGLALSASHGIVHSYGGTIGYFRNEAGGATFYFELPVMDAVDHGHDRAAVLRRPVGADV